jgi:hypothetical protein
MLNLTVSLAHHVVLNVANWLGLRNGLNQEWPLMMVCMVVISWIGL